MALRAGLGAKAHTPPPSYAHSQAPRRNSTSKTDRSYSLRRPTAKDQKLAERVVQSRNRDVFADNSLEFRLNSFNRHMEVSAPCSSRQTADSLPSDRSKLQIDKQTLHEIREQLEQLRNKSSDKTVRSDVEGILTKINILQHTN